MYAYNMYVCMYIYIYYMYTRCRHTSAIKFLDSLSSKHAYQQSRWTSGECVACAGGRELCAFLARLRVRGNMRQCRRQACDDVHSSVHDALYAVHYRLQAMHDTTLHYATFASVRPYTRASVHLCIRSSVHPCICACCVYQGEPLV